MPYNSPIQGRQGFFMDQSKQSIEMKFHKGHQEYVIDTAKISIYSTYSELRIEKTYEKKTANTGQTQ